MFEDKILSGMSLPDTGQRAQFTGQGESAVSFSFLSLRFTLKCAAQQFGNLLMPLLFSMVEGRQALLVAQRGISLMLQQQADTLDETITRTLQQRGISRTILYVDLCPIFQ